MTLHGETEAIFTERICAVIPMYRVESTIQSVITNIPAWIWKIIVVDDASPDCSTARVMELDDDRVMVASHEQNQGVGGAMMTGYDMAQKIGATILLKVDGDNQMPLEYLADLVRPIVEGKADYTKGNRFVHAQELRKMPLMRRVGNLCLSFITKVASGYWNVFDPANGFTALDVDVYRRLDLTNVHRRYYFETSMLVELRLARAVVREVLIPAKYQGEISSLSVSRVAREFPMLLVRSFLRRIWLQYFVIDFSVASLFITTGSMAMILGSTWGGLAWWRSTNTGVPATTGTVMLAVLPFILGFQLVIQAMVQDIQDVPNQAISRFAQHRLQRQGQSATT